MISQKPLTADLRGQLHVLVRGARYFDIRACFLFFSHFPPLFQHDFPYYLKLASLIIGSLLLCFYLYIFSSLANELPWTSVHCPTIQSLSAAGWLATTPTPPPPSATPPPDSVHTLSPGLGSFSATPARSPRVSSPPAGRINHRSHPVLSPEKGIAQNPGHVTFERVPGPKAGSRQTDTKIKGRRI